jgi:hypothetical protein
MPICPAHFEHFDSRLLRNTLTVFSSAPAFVVGFMVIDP